jgi:prevent-host-death family protein
MQVNIHEAKTQLSQLLERARRGEEVVIAKNGKPYARLVPLGPLQPRQPGLLHGKVEDSFFDALPEAELALWE